MIIKIISNTDNSWYDKFINRYWSIYEKKSDNKYYYVDSIKKQFSDLKILKSDCAVISENINKQFTCPCSDYHEVKISYSDNEENKYLCWCRICLFKFVKRIKNDKIISIKENKNNIDNRWNQLELK